MNKEDAMTEILTEAMVYELSESLNPSHAGEAWPDPIAWGGRPLREQAEDLLVLADTETECQHLPENSKIKRIIKAAKAVREAIS
jgi:hypothetical protein